MDSKIKLAVIGGFLGAGKTTTIQNLAKNLTKMGKKVGIVTNDQGSDLVDTKYLKSAGFPVMEVAGGCFCCNFDEFAKKVTTLAQTHMPDIILAEPVGSCTDLVATIFKPMQLSMASRFSLAPLCVVVDPQRAKKLMMSEEKSDFQDEIGYLFSKQIEEADVIMINKTDLYDQREIDSIEKFLREKYKGAVITKVSAKNEDNLSSVLPIMLGQEATDKPMMDLDYSVYGLAEDFLGWFNGTAFISSSNGGADFKSFIYDFMEGIKKQIVALDKEIAHLKVYLISKTDYIKASITSVDDVPDFSKEVFDTSRMASFVINARINIEPEILEPIVQQAFEETVIKHHLTYTGYDTDCFKPGMPDPTARLRAQGIEVKCACCAGASG